ncbi:helix-turn-helix domain-containing protein [Paraburkholderia antibiotica]|uniref:IS21 family transposase n=1 Tax=Paraburkholderia antibiotica TaxID=2728839 RepID=A0A7X9X5F4_9BURK|nr:helix-turn-helix domain-containing protein [Paraburkholderia antibiotica]NML31771.1 IS21 family transposase [Paraburkholderia antibiotica]
MQCTDVDDGRREQFLALIDGLTIERVAEVLRCCTRSVRNWRAGRSPVPWWRIEFLRIWRHNLDADPDARVLPEDSALANVVTEEQECLAWVSVTAPHFLSSRHAYEHYLKGWDVAGKIRRAKAAGQFRDVLRRWRELAKVEVRRWRDGPLFQGSNAPVSPR